jgi:hypothetical protein
LVDTAIEPDESFPIFAEEDLKKCSPENYSDNSNLDSVGKSTILSS